MTDRLIGKTLGGCRIIRQLGRGGMSTIYLAHQESVGREVALKVLSPNLLGDKTFMDRFTREVQTTARLQHPHIIPVYDYGEEDGLPFIVMAYVPGGSVEDLLAAGPVEPQRSAALVTQIATALDYANERGVIHRDIKPANILLDSQHNAILTDFGIAKVIAATDSLTIDTIVGTFAYLAPETLSQNNPITPAADVYSLAVTLYQLLTGELPFKATDSVSMMWAHVNQPVPIIAPDHPELPPTIDILLQKALAKSPAARYSGAGDLAQDLTQVLGGKEPSASKDVTPVAPAAEPPAPIPGQVSEAVQRAISQVVKILLPNGGNGSGLFVKSDQVLTCRHVVDGEPGVYVLFHNGEQIEADVIATDLDSDLALLRLRQPPKSLPPGQMVGISEEQKKLEPGQPLIAIGHPLGLDWSVTGGHFNAIRKPGEEPLPRFGINLKAPLVQVDVTINAGNSGGPLIDAGGRLVGLADSIINPAIANNIGFAIEAGAVWAFWKKNRETPGKLIPYNCGHHHAPDLSFCPLTGKPIQPRDLVPMTTSESVPYSCGHHHPPGLQYCPLTGKPARMMDVSALETAVAPENLTRQVAEKPCTNCKHVYPVNQPYCPKCGKPR